MYRAGAVSLVKIQDVQCVIFILLEGRPLHLIIRASLRWKTSIRLTIL